VSHNTKAILLSRRPFSEDDCLVTLFTQRYGKIQAKAISALKPTSKLRGHLEPGRLIDVMLTHVDRTGRLAQVVTIENYMSHEPVRSTATFALLDLIALMSQHVPDTSMWEAAITSLRQLSESDHADQLLSSLGVGLMRLLDAGGVGVESPTNIGKINAHIQWHFDKKLTSLSKIGALELDRSIY